MRVALRIVEKILPVKLSLENGLKTNKSLQLDPKGSKS